MKKTLLIVLGAILILAGPMVVLTGTAYTLMLPNIYQSTARISVQDTDPKTTCDAPCSHCSVGNPQFLRTQMEIIQSKPILYEVAKRLNLQEEWGREGEKLPRSVACKILKNSIVVFQHRDTTLIAISVKCDSPNGAAKIANEIAETYRDSRLDRLLKEKRAAITHIEAALKEQRARVDAAQTVVEELRFEIKCFDDADRYSDVDPIRLQQLEGDRLLAQMEMIEKEGLLKVMEELEGKPLMERASCITFDRFVVKTIQQIKDVETKLVSLEKDYGPSHPEVMRYRLQKETLHKGLEQRLVALKRSLRTEFLMAKSKFESVDKILATTRQSAINASSEKYKPFRKALAEFESERFLYEQLKAKLRQKTIELEVPQNPVEIIDVAEPNNRPVSPNLFTNVLLSLGLAAISVGAGIVLIVVGIRKR